MMKLNTNEQYALRVMSKLTPQERETVLDVLKYWEDMGGEQ